MLAQVSQAPGTDPIALRLRAAQDMSFQRRLLTRSELFRSASARTVVQTVRALSIEALDGIVQSLALHAGQPGGFGPGHAFQGIGNRQQPKGGPTILLAGRPRAQI
jgi:hypothetical protein